MASTLVLPSAKTALHIREAIAQGMIRSGMTKRQLANRTAIPYSTLCRKLNDPSTMTLAELSQIISAVGMEIEVTDSKKGVLK